MSKRFQSHAARCLSGAACAFAVLLIGPTIAQTAESPRLLRLQEEAGRAGPEAEARFWREIDEAGAPLIEEVEQPIHEYLVTFLWRGGLRTASVIVLSSLNFAEAPRDHMMHRLPDTNVWYRSYRFSAGTSLLYELSPSDSLAEPDEGPPGDFATRLQRDPRNARYLPGPMGGSYIVLPGSEGHEWSQGTQSTDAVEDVRLRSAILGEDRSLKVFVPTLVDDVDCLNLLVLFDADWAVGSMRVPSIMQRLTDAGELPPTAGAFVVQEDRSSELQGNEEFARFVAREVVPWMRGRYPVCRDRTRTMVGGVSAGGLAAALTALRHSETFGGVLVLSGSLRWAPKTDAEREWMARQWSTSPRPNVRVALGVGRYETVVPQGENQVSLVVAHRHFRDVLHAGGSEVRLVPFEGAHEPLSWRGALPDALRWLSAHHSR